MSYLQRFQMTRFPFYTGGRFVRGEEMEHVLLLPCPSSHLLSPPPFPLHLRFQLSYSENIHLQ